MDQDLEARTELFEKLLGLADDHLILGHRISQWCGHAPMLEEDLALPNIALDLLGQARLLYSYAGEMEAKGRDEDQLAFLRNERDYKNCLLVERPNGDFAFTMLRIFYFSTFMRLFWRSLLKLQDVSLSEIAAKAEKESEYHQRHSAEWVIRLGDGTPESHERMISAQNELDLYTSELFEPSKPALTNVWPEGKTILKDWTAEVTEILAEATLVFKPSENAIRGGRKGLHTEDFGFLLAELQFLQKTYPNATW